MLDDPWLVSDATEWFLSNLKDTGDARTQVIHNFILHFSTSTLILQKIFDKNPNNGISPMKHDDWLKLAESTIKDLESTGLVIPEREMIRLAPRRKYITSTHDA